MIWLVNKNDIRLLTCDNLYLFSSNINWQKIRPSLSEIGEVKWITYAGWSPGETPRLDLKEYQMMQIAQYCAILVSDKKIMFQFIKLRNIIWFYYCCKIIHFLSDEKESSLAAKYAVRGRILFIFAVIDSIFFSIMVFNEAVAICCTNVLYLGKKIPWLWQGRRK